MAMRKMKISHYNYCGLFIFIFVNFNNKAKGSILEITISALASDFSDTTFVFVTSGSQMMHSDLLDNFITLKYRLY